jgi:hypothetical protein
LLAISLTASRADAGPFTRLQVLLPGETAAPGTPSGKTGTPRAQVTGIPYSITVRACDDTWTTVTTVTHSIEIDATDASATLPAPAQLSSGVRAFTITMNAAGTFTVFARDLTDNTIPDGTSAAVTVQVLDRFEFSTINQKNQYAGVPMTITLTARTPSGSVVTGYSGPVSLKELTSYGDGRISPSTVTLSAGTWTGSVTNFRADETSINRGNVNIYAYLASNPSKNGTSDPFTVHPGPFQRVQIVVPGQTALPGSVSGLTGSPATQGAGSGFPVSVYSTDNYWNPVPSGDVVRVTSTDPAANTPQSGALSNGFRQFTIILNTVGSRTLTVSDVTTPSITSMTSAAIQVIPAGVDHFVILPIASVSAGTPTAVTIHATDSGGNLVPNYAGDAFLSANTGAGSISPTDISFSAGLWSGNVTFRGAGGAVTLTCTDFSSPPKTGTSAPFVVQPGPFAGLQVLLPGETPQGGTVDGHSGTPNGQAAGTPFNLTVRAVDAYWNHVSGVSDRIALASSDSFAAMPAETVLANGLLVMPITLYKSGSQRIWASDVDQPAILPDTSSAVTVTGGAFSRVLVLAPGESPAPGTATGRTGTATDQSITYSFTITVLATDSWWNPVGGVTDVVHITSTDGNATLPPDEAMVDGRAEMSIRLKTGGFQQITVTDVTNPSKTGSTTQVRAISSGFHLEASIDRASARAGDIFNVTVRVTNAAGSVIQEINSAVTLEVQQASNQQPGRGTLLTTQFQLLQGTRTVQEMYTFAEPIQIIARDDAGNLPAVTNVITIDPGLPYAVRLASNPTWVGGNKHSTVTARVVDQFENGVPNEPVTFALLSGTGTLSAVDSVTTATGDAVADFLSPRSPEVDRVRATSNALSQELDIQVAFIDPGAEDGYVSNYPNPFHPPGERTTIAYKLKDHATVTLRIYNMAGDLVRRIVFERAAPGGTAGLNEYAWDGRNGEGEVVSSGGYLALIEAEGIGETLHVLRRKVAVVR